MKKLMIRMIRFYQRVISPMHPPCCRFIPTCSQYALEAVEEYGALKGAALALWRLLKCQPLHYQKYIQYDPIPKYKTKGPYKKLPHPVPKPDVVEE